MSLKHMPILQKFLLTILVMAAAATILGAVSWREITNLRDTMLTVGAKEEAAREYKSSALPRSEYPPLWGLTVYWDQ